MAGQLKAYAEDANQTDGPVRHVNLGLLPSSQLFWDSACRVLDVWRGGWLHVHEKVAVRGIEQKKAEIMTELARLRTSRQGNLREPVVDCCHVEHVKTCAPGVMHCVSDIQLSGSKDAREGNG